MKKSTLLLLYIILACLVFQVCYASQPYVLIVSFDGFRWDYLHRGLSPFIQSLADSGVEAISLKPCYPSVTFPNHYSIITGQYPEHHGIIFNNFEDQENGKVFKLFDSNSVRDESWYKGEAFWETANKNGIITASYFWPGSEITREGRHPTYYMKYNNKTSYKDRVDGIINWLKLPFRERPHFMTLYFDETDTKGHSFGVDSREVNDGIRILDNQIKYLFGKLTEIGMKDSINIIILSDHGMHNLDTAKTINIKQILAENYNKVHNYGTLAFVRKAGISRDSLINAIKDLNPHFKVYKKEEFPEYLHFSENPLISNVLIKPDDGWYLTDGTPLSKSYLATHGWDNNWMDMNGIFIAYGPLFRKGFKCGTLNNIDIYPLLCRIYNLEQNNNIDGKIEDIEYILK